MNNCRKCILINFDETLVRTLRDENKIEKIEINKCLVGSSLRHLEIGEFKRMNKKLRENLSNLLLYKF